MMADTPETVEPIEPVEPTVASMVEQLETLPVLDPDLDYRDATNALMVLGEQVRILQNRMAEMERVLQLQATINGRMIDGYRFVQDVHLQLSEITAEAQKSSLILPERLSN